MSLIIQAAIDASADGSTIHVSGGSYAPVEMKDRRLLVVGDADGEKMIFDAHVHIG